MMPERQAHLRGGPLQAGARVLLVPGFILAIGMMLKGYADVGDGFSAGVIAALVIITQGLAFGADELENIAAARLAPMLGFIGLGLAYTVVFLPVLFGYPMLTHFPRMNHEVTHFGVLELITPVLFDLGVFLVVYGFCVGAMMAVSRAEVRHHRLIRRARKRAAQREGDKS